MITIERMAEDKFVPIWRPHYKTVFANEPEYDHTDTLESDAKKKVTELRRIRNNLTKIFLLAKVNGEVAGWSWGFQSMDDNFYMCNSGVLPEFRRKGIYKTLLDTMLDEAKNEGFQVIHSKHLISNNPIIIAKLKSGFCITGTELDVRYGLNVTLSYYVSELSRKVHAYRSGSIGRDEELEKAITV